MHHEEACLAEAQAELSFDRASFRNKGGLLQKLVSQYKIRRYGLKAGKGLIIKRNAAFVLTDGAHLEIGDNCVIQDYAFINLTKPHPRVIIGRDVVIGRHNMITAKNFISIGDFTRIGAYVQIIDHNHGMQPEKLIKDQQAVLGEVTIGKDVWIGAGAKILMGAHIGDGAVIGANAVVTSVIPANAIAVGIPAKVLRYR